MRSLRFAVAVGVIMGVSALPASAFAPGVNIGRSDTAIAITGFVPVICHARVDAASVSPESGVVSLGELREFCNSPAGYRVYADYSPSLADAELIVDGVSVPLQANGSTLVSQSSKAAIDHRQLELALPKDVGPNGTISFRIEPL